MHDENLKFYGRKQGRPLRITKKKLIEDDLSQYKLTVEQFKNNKTFLVNELFSQNPQKVALEIGFGQGEHLAEFAEKNSDWGIIGIEVFLNGIANLLKLIKDSSLNNIRIFPNDGRLLLPYLPPGSFDMIIVLFPDPWPKIKHYKRRLIQSSFIKELTALLKPRGTLRIATDHSSYLTWIQNIMENSQGLTPIFNWNNIPVTKPVPWVMTSFEAKAIQKGNTCYYMDFKKDY